MVEIEERCASLLRELRKKRGLTLRECEEASGGKFKAVVMGSYERGTRAISLERLQEIADFYEVPIQYFFGADKAQVDSMRMRLTFDLRRLRSSQKMDASFERISQLLALFISKRRDFNGEVLSIRESDGDLLQLITDDGEIFKKLEFHKLILMKTS
jgi:transcriptional regulator with XRE-family HTH domain